MKNYMKYGLFGFAFAAGIYVGCSELPIEIKFERGAIEYKSSSVPESKEDSSQENKPEFKPPIQPQRQYPKENNVQLFLPDGELKYDPRPLDWYPAS